MLSMLPNRLPGAREILVRLGQVANISAERWGVSRLGSVDVPSGWLSEGARDGRDTALADPVRHLTIAGPGATAEAAATVKAFLDPGRLGALVDRAQSVVDGRMSLLGLEDLSFGHPIDWHLEPTSGRRTALSHWSAIPYLDAAVAGDKKVTWELNRHQYLLTLGRAYALTREERYARTFVSHLTGWMDANPPTRGINWASSLEVAFRAISWVWALDFFRQSSEVTPDFVQRCAWLLHVHGTHIERYLSTYFSPNTHLTGEALGLFYLGTCLPELRHARRWQRVGAEILIDQIQRQVRDDGTYFEQSTWYHRYTCDFYLHFLILARRFAVSLPPHIATRTELLVKHMIALTRPNGTFPLLGDDDGGRFLPLDDAPLTDWRSTISTAAVLFERADFKYAAGTLAEETIWLLGSSAQEAFARLDCHPPDFTSIGFPRGGFYASRSDWSPTAQHLVVDAGPHGALSCGHGHADALSFELSVQGLPLIVDSGTFTYTGSGDARNTFRSTRAHNTPVIDGRSSSEPGGPFSWRTKARTTTKSWLTGTSVDYLHAQHDGFERLPGPVTHRRAFAVIKNEYVVIFDRFETAGSHDYEVPLHFSTECRVSGSSDRYAVSRRDTSQPLLFVTIAKPEADNRIVDDDVSPIYGRKCAAQSLLTAFSSTGPDQLVTLLSNSPLGRVVASETSKGSRALLLQGANSTDYLGSGDWISEPASVRARADFAWIRVDAAGNLLRAFFVGLQSFSVGTTSGHSRTPLAAVELDANPQGAISGPPVDASLQFLGFSGSATRVRSVC